MTDIRDFRDITEYRQWLCMYRLFRDYPVDEIRAAGKRHLPDVAANVSGEYYERLVDDWRMALDDPGGSRLRQIALAMGQYGVDMRQISPLYGVMSQEDWLKVIKDSRNETRMVPQSVAVTVS